MSRVLVCGGRDYSDRDIANKVLDGLHQIEAIEQIIHGAAKGADTLAGEWAICNGVPVLAVPADWDLYRKRAGPIRNRKMLTIGKPDFVLAFPGGVGTANMVKQALDSGVLVYEVSAHGVINVREGKAVVR